MPISKLIVTLVGLAAIVWVLWYFLAPSATSHQQPATSHQPPAS
jgi:plastocyanin domain-containing protein